MDDDLEAPPPRGEASGAAGDLVVQLGLLEVVCDLVADLPRLQEAAVGQGGVIGRGRGEVPLFVRGIKSVSVSACVELREGGERAARQLERDNGPRGA